jgi:hypothetical protein
MQSLQHFSRPLDWQRRGDKYLLWAKRGIWVYFWLLILEGALRKWILPGLSAPLLIVRDPIVLFIYWSAYRSRRIPSRDLAPFAIVALMLVALAMVQVAIRIDDPSIALYGVRSYLLHLPLIFVVKYAFTKKDVRKVGRWLMILSVPMTLLMVQQYRASPTSWLNAGAGGATGAQLIFTGEHVRASGTFSFVTGTADFFPFVQAFLIFGIARIGTYPNWLMGAATVANIVALPVSGSRTLFFASIVVVGCGVLSLLSNLRSFSRLITVGAGVLITALICSQVPVFRDSLTSFRERWETADRTEGGEGAQGILKLRVLDALIQPFATLDDQPLLGNGIGLGSNVAAASKTGEQGFLLSESEWPRMVEECGPFFGVLFLGYRVLLCGMLIAAPLSLRGRHATLGLLLAAAVVPQILLNGIEQTTNLGFMALGGGLCLAAAKRTKIPQVVSQLAPVDSRFYGRLPA